MVTNMDKFLLLWLVVVMGTACTTTSAQDQAFASALPVSDSLLLQLQSENPKAEPPFPDWVTLPNGPGLRVGDRVYRLLPLSQLKDRRLSVAQPLIKAAKPFEAYIEGAFGAMGVVDGPRAVAMPPEVVPQPANAPPVRDQGSRLTCVTFAALAAMEYRADVPDDLSEEYAYHASMLGARSNCCTDPGLAIFDATAELFNLGVPVEADWTYRADASKCENDASCFKPPHPAAIPTTNERYKIQQAWLLTFVTSTAANIRNTAYLEALLAAGYQIPFLTGVAWGAENAKGIRDVHIDKTTNLPFEPWGLHAMVLVGYNRNDEYFVARNSMGGAWGSHGGDAWLSYKYLRVYAVAGFVIDSIRHETFKHP